MFKLCRACGENKPFSAFSSAPKSKGDRHGLRSRCKPCRAAANLAWHQRNKIRSTENHMRWLAANPARVKAQAKKWMRENPERHAAISRDWARANRPRRTASVARRKATQMQATPLWLSAIQMAQIQEFYEVAAARTTQTGIEHQVDHVHPLQGVNFRGLHVPWNLQVLTASENAAKKNRLEVRHGICL